MRGYIPRHFVGYSSAHDRVRRTRGAVSEHPCALKCGQMAAEWAYDHADRAELIEPLRARNGFILAPYSLNPAHYLPLCRSCHRRFDHPHRRRTRAELLASPPPPPTSPRLRTPRTPVEPDQVRILAGGAVSTGSAARLLGVAPATVIRWSDSGALPCRRLPTGIRRFRLDDVLAFRESAAA